MTDLAARIADVKESAEAAMQAYKEMELGAGQGYISAKVHKYWEDASPDLFLAMAARIEELELEVNHLKLGLQQWQDTAEKLSQSSEEKK